MSNNYAPYFKRFNFVVIPSYIELSWFNASIFFNKIPLLDDKHICLNLIEVNFYANKKIILIILLRKTSQFRILIPEFMDFWRL